MPRDIGPELLAELEADLDSGRITQPEYESRKVQVLERIRTGQAVERSAGEKALKIVAVVALILIGLWILSNGGPTSPGFIVALGMIGFGIYIWVKR